MGAVFVINIFWTRFVFLCTFYVENTHPAIIDISDYEKLNGTILKNDGDNYT